MLIALRNLGPKSAAMLHKAGIITPEQLARMGSVAAFMAVKRAGHVPSLNLLWALEGALNDEDWRSVSKQRRNALLIELDQMQDEYDSKANQR